MNILAVTFDSELAGGANRSFLMVISELRERYQHKIHVIIPNHGPIEKELQNAEFDFECVELKAVGVLLGNSPKRILSKAKANWYALDHYVKARKYSKKAKAYGYDLVYINCANNLFGCYVARNLGIPYVWHFRGLFLPELYYVYNQRKLYNDPSARIIAISTSMQESLPIDAGIRMKQIVMVHNGLPFSNVKLSKQEWDHGIHIVLCGRLFIGKGHLDAIRAIGELNNRGYDEVYLHIAGDISNVNHDYMNRLHRAIEFYKLGNHVIFEGQISDMAKFRENMNIELMCSICEPFGRVTVEGMRSGLIVIGANTGGTIDIIQDGYNGYLYQQGNSVDLADKLQYVIDNKEEALCVAKRAIDFTKTHFTVEQNVSAINLVLCEAVQKG